MLLYLKICSWNGPFIALVYQVAEEVRVTKGNIISFLICCLLWIYPSLEKQTIRPALNVYSVSGFSALFSLYIHPLSTEKWIGKRDSLLRGGGGVFTPTAISRLTGVDYCSWRRNRTRLQISFFWTSIQTLTKEFNSGKIRHFSIWQVELSR